MKVAPSEPSAPSSVGILHAVDHDEVTQLRLSSQHCRSVCTICLPAIAILPASAALALSTVRLLTGEDDVGDLGLTALEPLGGNRSCPNRPFFQLFSTRRKLNIPDGYRCQQAAALMLASGQQLGSATLPRSMFRDWRCHSLAVV